MPGGGLPAKSRQQKDGSSKEKQMFPYNDPYAMLDLQRQRANQLADQAAVARQAREAQAAAQPKVRRFGRWPRRAARPAVAA